MAESKNAKKVEETFTLEIEGGLVAKIRKPSRKIVGQALGMVIPMGHGDKPDPLTAGEWVLRTCWIDGDKSILEDEDNLIAASLKCLDLIKLKEAALKKN
jgi:hypothetical protein